MIKLVEELPETTVIVFALITTALDDAKPKAKTKKLVETVEKRGAVCKFPLLSVNAVAGMAARKSAKAGCTLSAQDAGVPCGALRVFADAASDRGREALHLPPERGDNPRRYKCAGSPDAGRQRLRPFRAAVRGKLRSGSAYARRPVSAAHGACAYPFGGVRGVRGLLPREARGQGREKLPAGGSGFRLLRRQSYYFGKACTKARGLSDGYLNACMEVLFRTNRLMNSSKTDSRLLLERAFTEISALKGARV